MSIQPLIFSDTPWTMESFVLLNVSIASSRAPGLHATLDRWMRSLNHDEDAEDPELLAYSGGYVVRRLLNDDSHIAILSAGEDGLDSAEFAYDEICEIVTSVDPNARITVDEQRFTDEQAAHAAFGH